MSKITTPYIGHVNDYSMRNRSLDSLNTTYSPNKETVKRTSSNQSERTTRHHKQTSLLESPVRRASHTTKHGTSRPNSSPSIKLKKGTEIKLLYNPSSDTDEEDSLQSSRKREDDPIQCCRKRSKSAPYEADTNRASYTNGTTENDRFYVKPSPPSNEHRRRIMNRSQTAEYANMASPYPTIARYSRSSSFSRKRNSFTDSSSPRSDDDDGEEKTPEEAWGTLTKKFGRQKAVKSPISNNLFSPIKEKKVPTLTAMVKIGKSRTNDKRRSQKLRSLSPRNSKNNIVLPKALSDSTSSIGRDNSAPNTDRESDLGCSGSNDGAWGKSRGGGKLEGACDFVINSGPMVFDTNRDIDLLKSLYIRQGERCRANIRSNLITCTSKSGHTLILAGTLEKIVFRLVDLIVLDNGKVDALDLENRVVFEMIIVFLHSYRKFTTPLYLLNILRGLWEQVSQPLSKINYTRGQVYNFLLKWFENRAGDFTNKTLATTEEWLRTMTEEHHGPLTAKLMKSISLIKNPPKMEYYIYTFDTDELSSETELICRGKFKILDLDPAEVAEQWSFQDMKQFMSITQADFYTKSGNLQKMLDCGRMLSQWVAYEIVSEIDMEIRKNTMAHLISIAINLLDFDNYNGLMWFWEGFKKKAVSRLVKTVQNLPTKMKDALTLLEEKLKSEDNYKLLKSATKAGLKQNRPVIPWLKAIRDSILSIEDSHNDFILHPTTYLPLLNFEKMWGISEQLKYFEVFHTLSLCFRVENKNPNALVLQDFFEKLPNCTDEVLWVLSLKCEELTEEEKKFVN